MRVGHRVDALVCAYKVPLDVIEFGGLVAAHREAVRLGVSRVEHSVAGTSFALGSTLVRGAYRLTNADMDVLVGPNEHGWTVEVTARALTLATQGLDWVVGRARRPCARNGAGPPQHLEGPIAHPRTRTQPRSLWASSGVAPRR
jgi:hypothetical protein